MVEIWGMTTVRGELRPAAASILTVEKGSTECVSCCHPFDKRRFLVDIVC